MSDQLTPASPDAERAALGSAIIDPDALDIIAEHLTAEHFFSEKNRIIFRALTELLDEGQHPDNVTLIERLRQRGNLEDCGGPAYIVGIMTETPGAYLIEQHVSSILETYRLRQLANVGYSIHMRVANGSSSEEIIRHAEEQIGQVTTDMGGGKSLPQTYLEEAESILNEDMGGYVQTGFYNLDRMLGGLKGVVIMAARPSSGKSSMARDIARNVIKSGKKVALFSPDQSGADIFRLEASLASGVNLTTIKGRKYTLTQGNAWKKALKNFLTENEDKFIIDDRPLTLPTLTARFRNAVKEGCDLVIVDYLQLVDVPGLKANEEYAGATTVSKALKRLSREYNIPVLALAQLNRGADGRTQPRPIMSDIRASGQIEQDADTIIFLHRPDKEAMLDVESVEFIVAKQKDGPIGVCNIDFRREFSTFLSSDTPNFQSSTQEVYSQVLPYAEN